MTKIIFLIAHLGDNGLKMRKYISSVSHNQNKHASVIQ